MDIGPPDNSPIRSLLPDGLAATRPSWFHPAINQDAYVLDLSHGVVAVLDGLGGQADGAFASNLVSQVITAQIDKFDPPQSGWTYWALAAARDQLLTQRHQLSSDTDTTAVIALLLEDTVEISWCGDSRAYGIYTDPDSPTRCLTTDHNQLAGARQGGAFTDHQVRHIQAILDTAQTASDAWRAGGSLAKTAWKHRNIITSSVAEGPIDTMTLPRPGLRAILLTSDGIHDNLTAAEISEMAAAFALDALATALINAAVTRSESDHGRAKPDDMTAVVLPITPQEP